MCFFNGVSFFPIVFVMAIIAVFTKYPYNHRPFVMSVRHSKIYLVPDYYGVKWQPKVYGACVSLK